MEAIGFTHGLFNVELFYQPPSGRITIIEINPRMAGSSPISTNASTARACGHSSSTSHRQDPVFPHRQGCFSVLPQASYFREVPGDAVKHAPRWTSSAG